MVPAVAAIGGIAVFVLLIAFVRSFWRKPPDNPGSDNPLGGMPGGGPDSDAT